MKSFLLNIKFIAPSVAAGALALAVTFGPSREPDLSLLKDQVGAVYEDPVATATQYHFISKWEWTGRELRAYQDIVGVWTICVGRTKNVKPGDTATKEQCIAWAFEDMASHEQMLDRCLDPVVLHKVPTLVKIAVNDLTYNIGPGRFDPKSKRWVGGVCGSSIRTLMNQQNWSAVCERLAQFNKAGGKVVRGLVNRRSDLQRVCREGL